MYHHPQTLTLTHTHTHTQPPSHICISTHPRTLALTHPHPHPRLYLYFIFNETVGQKHIQLLVKTSTALTQTTSPQTSLFCSLEVWHHGHIMMLMNMYYLITKDACCHCRSVYLPNAKIPEVTLSFVIDSFPSCSWYQRSCTGFQKVSRCFRQWLQIDRYAILVPRMCPAHFSWPHMWPLNCPTSLGS